MTLQSTSMQAKRQCLMLGTLALALSGLFSVVVAGARSPTGAFATWFSKSLVLHVDLSVLVWFFAMAAFFMAKKAKPQFVKPALAMLLVGTLLMTASFFGAGTAYFSNYIPVIESHVFFWGLSLTLAAMGALSVSYLFTKRTAIEDYHAWGVRGVALIILFSLAAFLDSAVQMPSVIEGEQYFEMLFWAGGHIWQFAFVTLMMLSWLFLFKQVRPAASLPNRDIGWIVHGHTFLAAIGLYGVIAFEPSSMAHREFFTYHMVFLGALCASILGLVLLRAALQEKKTARPDLAMSLYSSWVLFIAGGLISLTITGQDTRIPAHYHGSVIAITIALMGVAFAYVGASGRWVKWQPVLYCVGKLLHIGGLAVSGGYGALRKTPGTDTYPLEAQIAMGVMGMGALLSMIAGLIFVVVIARALWKKPV